jgi:hypothetical protein
MVISDRPRRILGHSGDSLPGSATAENAAPAVLSSDKLAWALVDLVAIHLKHEDKTAIYVELGCRHHRRAITRTLETCLQHRIIVPTSMINDVDAWRQAYDGHADERKIRGMIDALRVGRRSVLPRWGPQR